MDICQSALRSHRPYESLLMLPRDAEDLLSPRHTRQHRGCRGSLNLDPIVKDAGQPGKTRSSPDTPLWYQSEVAPSESPQSTASSCRTADGEDTCGDGDIEARSMNHVLSSMREDGDKCDGDDNLPLASGDPSDRLEPQREGDVTSAGADEDSEGGSAGVVPMDCDPPESLEPHEWQVVLTADEELKLEETSPASPIAPRTPNNASLNPARVADTPESKPPASGSTRNRKSDFPVPEYSQASAGNSTETSSIPDPSLHLDPCPGEQPSRAASQKATSVSVQSVCVPPTTPTSGIRRDGAPPITSASYHPNGSMTDLVDENATSNSVTSGNAPFVYSLDTFKLQTTHIIQHYILQQQLLLHQLVASITEHPCVSLQELQHTVRVQYRLLRQQSIQQTLLSQQLEKLIERLESFAAWGRFFPSFAYDGQTPVMTYARDMRWDTRVPVPQPSRHDAGGNGRKRVAVSARGGHARSAERQRSAPDPESGESSQRRSERGASRPATSSTLRFRETEGATGYATRSKSFELSSEGRSRPEGLASEGRLSRIVAATSKAQLTASQRNHILGEDMTDASAVASTTGTEEYDIGPVLVDPTMISSDKTNHSVYGPPSQHFLPGGQTAGRGGGSARPTRSVAKSACAVYGNMTSPLTGQSAVHEGVKTEAGMGDRSLESDGAMKRTRKAHRNSMANMTHRCSLCSSNLTPQWRYLDSRRFCNACYMRIKRHLATKGMTLNGLVRQDLSGELPSGLLEIVKGEGSRKLAAVEKASKRTKTESPSSYKSGDETLSGMGSPGGGQTSSSEASCTTAAEAGSVPSDEEISNAASPKLGSSSKCNRSTKLKMDLDEDDAD